MLLIFQHSDDRLISSMHRWIVVDLIKQNKTTLPTALNPHSVPVLLWRQAEKIGTYLRVVQPSRARARSQWRLRKVRCSAAAVTFPNLRPLRTGQEASSSSSFSSSQVHKSLHLIQWTLTYSSQSEISETKQWQTRSQPALPLPSGKIPPLRCIMCSEDTKLLPPLPLWTVDAPRREKQYATKTVYNWSEELLTATGEIVL